MTNISAYGKIFNKISVESTRPLNISAYVPADMTRRLLLFELTLGWPPVEEHCWNHQHEHENLSDYVPLGECIRCNN